MWDIVEIWSETLGDTSEITEVFIWTELNDASFLGILFLRSLWFRRIFWDIKEISIVMFMRNVYINILIADFDMLASMISEWDLFCEITRVFFFW